MTAISHSVFMWNRQAPHQSVENGIAVIAEVVVPTIYVQANRANVFQVGILYHGAGVAG